MAVKFDLTKLSRTISHALRHNPGQYGLKLDEAGWAPVKNLLEALRHRRSEWKRLCEDDIVAMMNFSDKQRFELRDGKIRALYGHSIRNKSVKVAIKPPDILFHGTSPKVVDKIQKVGLKPMAVEGRISPLSCEYWLLGHIEMVCSSIKEMKRSG